MDWKSIGGMVGKAAPWIGSLLGGKAGEAAGKLVASVLGVENSPDAVSKALENNPDALVKLKQAEMDHVERLKELSFEERKAELASGIRHREIDTADIQGARGRDEKLRLAGYKNRRADGMIITAFLCLIFIIAMLWNKPEMPGAVLAVFNMSVGYILKMISDAFQFEFGSSRGSKEKDILRSSREE